MSVLSSVQIHWFPGHMKKALNEVENKIKVVDIVVELIDSRIPFSSLNPYFESRIKNKPKMLVLTKADLADENLLKPCIKKIEEEGYIVVSGSLNDKATIDNIKRGIKSLTKTLYEKWIKKGMKPQPVRAMIIGVPNVGKSTLINKLAKRKATGVENKPGFTRSEQWVKVDNDFILLDTPGVLPYNYENKENAVKIALTGAIREKILPKDVLAAYLLEYFKTKYPHALKSRFDIDDISSKSDEEIYKLITLRRGLKQNHEFDFDIAINLLLKEFKDGLLGRYVLDEVTNA